MFLAGLGHPPKRSVELPKFTIYIQEGSVFLKVVVAWCEGEEAAKVSVFPNVHLSSFFFPWCPEPGLERQASKAGTLGPGARAEQGSRTLCCCKVEGGGQD